MKTNRFYAILALVLSLTVTSVSPATITFVPSSTNVVVGSSFSVSIYGTPSIDSAGYSLYLESSSIGSGIEITSQVLNTSLLSYGGASPLMPETISSTTQSSDLGAFSNDTLSANQSYLLSTITISLDSSLNAGTYTIFSTTGIAGTVFADPTFSVEDFASYSYFTINAELAPEPGILCSLVTGLTVIIGCCIYRSKAQQRDEVA